VTGSGIRGEPLTPALLLKLQRQAGNRAVLKLLRAIRQQAKDEASAAEPEPPQLGEAPPSEPPRAEVERTSEPNQSGAIESEEQRPAPPVPRRPWWRRSMDWLRRRFG
jgi:hypothetical protein